MAPTANNVGLPARRRPSPARGRALSPACRLVLGFLVTVGSISGPALAPLAPGARYAFRGLARPRPRCGRRAHGVATSARGRRVPCRRAGRSCSIAGPRGRPVVRYPAAKIFPALLLTFPRDGNLCEVRWRSANRTERAAAGARSPI
jgi:hypothetical protein